MIIRGILLAREKRSKGLSLVVSAVLGALFTIGVIALFYWLFLSKILEIHVAIDEATTERHAINLANVLISSEKLAYEDGKIQRGVLDSNKLDNLFIKKDTFLSDVSRYILPVDIGIGYPNTLNLVEVLDLEKCDNIGNCDGWIASLSGPISLEGLDIVKFATCLAENIKIDVGSIFRFAGSGILLGHAAGAPAALWQPWDIEKCVKNTIPPSLNEFFTNSEISSKGLPVLIRYQDGTMHVGRIIVGVGEWL